MMRQVSAANTHDTYSTNRFPTPTQRTSSTPCPPTPQLDNTNRGLAYPNHSSAPVYPTRTVPLNDIKPMLQPFQNNSLGECGSFLSSNTSSFQNNADESMRYIHDPSLLTYPTCTSTNPYQLSWTEPINSSRLDFRSPPPPQIGHPLSSSQLTPNNFNANNETFGYLASGRSGLTSHSDPARPSQLNHALNRYHGVENPEVIGNGSHGKMNYNTMSTGLTSPPNLLARPNNGDGHAFPRSKTACVQQTEEKSASGTAHTKNGNSSATLMTPDSSTMDFVSHKFGPLSDDGEISPTNTSTSDATRIRKAAPTLATGRRNLKGEPVDADEADRRMKRRERNRRSAQKCRERKVQRTNELQAHVECLQMEANRLNQEIEKWREQVRQCVALLHQHCPTVAAQFFTCFQDTSDLGDLAFHEHKTYEYSDDIDMTKKSNQLNVKISPQSSITQTTINTSPDADKRAFDSDFVVAAAAKHQHTPLPPVSSLNSRLNVNRSQSLFMLKMAENPASIDSNLEATGPAYKHNTLVNSIERTRFVPDLPSNSSSSSSGSAYELHFPTGDSSSGGLVSSNDDGKLGENQDQHSHESPPPNGLIDKSSNDVAPTQDWSDKIALKLETELAGSLPMSSPNKTLPLHLQKGDSRG